MNAIASDDVVTSILGMGGGLLVLVAYMPRTRFTIELPAVRDLSEFGATTNGEKLEKGPP